MYAIRSYYALHTDFGVDRSQIEICIGILDFDVCTVCRKLAIASLASTLPAAFTATPGGIKFKLVDELQVFVEDGGVIQPGTGVHSRYIL